MAAFPTEQPFVPALRETGWSMYIRLPHHGQKRS